MARRTPGGAFGAGEVIASGTGSLFWFQPAVAATGEALVAYTSEGLARAPYSAGVHVAIAPAGGSFAPAVRVADARWLSYPSLDVAADGRALLAVNGGSSMRVAERAPGAPFGATSAISPRAPGIFSHRPRASAQTARRWWLGRPGQAGGLEVATRPAGGRFAAPFAVTTGQSAPYAPLDPFFASETYYRALLDDKDAELDRPEADARATDRRRPRAVRTHRAGSARHRGRSLASLPATGRTPTIAPVGQVHASGVEAAAFLLADRTPAYDGEPLVTRTVEVLQSARTATLTLPARQRLRWVAVRSEYDAGPGAVFVTRVELP